MNITYKASNGSVKTFSLVSKHKHEKEVRAWLDSIGSNQDFHSLKIETTCNMNTSMVESLEVTDVFKQYNQVGY